MEETWELAALDMADNNSKIKLSIKKDGFEASAEGQAAEDTSGVLKALIAPLVARQESKAETIRHHNELKYIRHVYNEEVTRRTAGIALGLIQDRGIVGSKPNDKFFLPWLSAVSLEENSDENPMPEMYAKLLVAETDGKSANGVLYIDFLKKFSTGHIKLLEKFRKNSTAEELILPINRISDEAIASILLKLAAPMKKTDGISEKEVKPLIDKIIDAYDIPGLIVFSFDYELVQMIGASEKEATKVGQIDATQRPIAYHSEILDALVSSGLVVRKLLQEKNGFQFGYSIEYAKLSPMGMDFVAKCMS